MPSRLKREEVTKPHVADQKVKPDENSHKMPKAQSSSPKTSGPLTVPISSNPSTPPRNIFRRLSQRISKKDPHIFKGKHFTYPINASLSSDNIVIENDQYCSAGVLKNHDEELIQTNVDGTELELRSPPDDTYERLSNDSICSNLEMQDEASGVLCENNLYVKKSDDLVIENDQYCTPDIIVGETNTVNYHEYTVPASRSESVYSEPHRMDDNESGSSAEVSKLPDPDVNPYSVCHLYPKTPHPPSEFLENVYAIPNEYVEVEEVTSEKSSDKCKSSLYKVTKLFFKMTAWHSDSSSATATQIKPKTNKKNIMRNIFKRKQGDVEDICNAINDEEIYATIDEEMLAKLESEKNIDKKMLEELKAILTNKKQTLKVNINKSL